MTTSREQFENFITQETGLYLCRTNYPMTKLEDQQYKQHATNMAWIAWQASRAALVVELPDEYFDGIDALVIPYDATVQSLSAVGITVKGDSDEQANS